MESCRQGDEHLGSIKMSFVAISSHYFQGKLYSVDTGTKLQEGRGFETLQGDFFFQLT
jgi:hypothetical protein